MNLLILFMLSLTAGETYSGVVTIDRVGQVALPPGDWLLEYAFTPDIKSNNPDIYVFKKRGDRLERLSIERYGPHIAGPIDSYFDSIGDLRANGIPLRLLDYKSNGEHDLVDMLRDPFVFRRTGDRVTAKGASYIYTSEVNEPWMSHAIVSAQTDCVLVCVHASPFAISPSAVRDVFSGSKFLEPPREEKDRTER
jgi:hypothetical protein